MTLTLLTLGVLGYLGLLLVALGIVRYAVGHGWGLGLLGFEDPEAILGSCPVNPHPSLPGPTGRHYCILAAGHGGFHRCALELEGGPS